MKTNLVLALMAAVLTSPALLAQAPIAHPSPQVVAQAKARYLSSNTVRAIFKGVRVLNEPCLAALLTPANATTPGEKIAIFEVIEPLAFQAESSLLSNRMLPGDLFSVDLSGSRAGQSPEVTSMAAALQEGEEVVVKVDEYMTSKPREGQHVINSASRMAKRKAVAELQAQDPDETSVQAQAPVVNNVIKLPNAAVTMNSNQLRRRNYFTQTINNNGNSQHVEVRQRNIPGTNEMQTRMFINGVEVDPETMQPLAAPRAKQQAQPQPQATEEQEVISDDLEKEDPSKAPIPPPAPVKGF